MITAAVITAAVITATVTVINHGRSDDCGRDRGSRDHGGCDHGDRRRLCSNLGERSEASTTRRRLVKFTESVKLLVKFIDMAGRIRWNAIWSMEEGNKETTRQAAAEIRSLISDFT